MHKILIKTKLVLSSFIHFYCVKIYGSLINATKALRAGATSLYSCLVMSPFLSLTWDMGIDTYTVPVKSFDKSSDLKVCLYIHDYLHCRFTLKPSKL